MALNLTLTGKMAAIKKISDIIFAECHIFIVSNLWLYRIVTLLSMGRERGPLFFLVQLKEESELHLQALTSLLLNYSLRFFSNYDLFMYIIVMKDKSMATLVAKCCYINVLTNFDFLFFVLILVAYNSKNFFPNLPKSHLRNQSLPFLDCLASVDSKQKLLTAK